MLLSVCTVDTMSANSNIFRTKEGKRLMKKLGTIQDLTPLN